MEYDVFISFPLSEKNKTFAASVNTKDFFAGQTIHHVLTHLLKVPTFFSDESLLNNDKSDFWEKIEEVMPKTKVLVIVLFNHEDYKREWCEKERQLYLDTHSPEERKIYFLLSDEAYKERRKYKDILDVKKGKPEIILWERLDQQQRFYNFINNYFGKNEPGNNQEVRICTQCHKIFYKGNEEGTICLHHRENDIDISEDGLKITFNCCNKVIHRENANAPFDIAPGCLEEASHHWF